MADAKAERYEKFLELVRSDRNVDGILVINMLKSCFFEPVLGKSKIPIYNLPEKAVKALKVLRAYGRIHGKH